MTGRVGATTSQVSGRLRGALSGRRELLTDRRVLIGLGAVIAVVLIGVVVTVVGPLNSGDRSAGPVGGLLSRGEVTAVVRFPEPAAGALGPEDRVRPVGVRSLELGFESPVVAEADAPSCASHDPDRDRAVWFDAPQGPGAWPGEPVAVAPGEHGVAVLLAGAGSEVAGIPFDGIGAAAAGARLEVARANGTVLAWRAVDVVVVASGSELPVEVLVPVAEQRLLLVGCGAVIDGEERDVYVLALRTR